MALRGLLRLGELQIRVTDMQAARQHYGQRMGLHEVMEDAEGLVYFKPWDEHDHHSLILRLADRPGIDYFAFKVYDDATLTRLAPKIEAFGLPVDHIPAGRYPKSGRRLEFTLPSGHTMQLYAEKERTGNTMGYHNPGTIPEENVVRGLRINRIDHVLLGGPKIDECARLFMEVFDFDLSERIEDAQTKASLGVFLTGSTKPHDIAFQLQTEPNRFHHVSFWLESASDVIKAADLIGHYRIPVDVSVNRHGVTRGVTIYFFDPSGNRNETFSEGYVHYPDVPTLVWDTNEMGHLGFSHDNQMRTSFFEVLT
jgi:catechol 2,3-dioxygenase